MKLPRKKNPKQAGIAIDTSDKTGFKTKLAKKDKKGQWVLIKVTIHQEDILNIKHLSTIYKAPNFMKQTTKGIKTA